MGLLNFNSEDAQIGLGLLAAGGARSDGANFGQRMLEGLSQGDRWKAQQAAAKRAEMQDQMAQMQMAQAQAQMQQQQASAQEQARINGILPSLIKRQSQGAPALNVDSLLPPDLRAGTPTLGAVPASAGGFDIQEALRQRVPLKTIEELQKLTAGPEFSPEVRYDQSGRAFMTAKNGEVKYLQGINARDKLIETDLGGTKGFRTEYSPKMLAELPKTMTFADRNAAANLGLSRERFNFEKTQGDKPQYIAELGGFANPRTQQVMPARDMRGNVIEGGGSGKMTEDQAKASGWLVQAENAYKNMKAATKANPDAAKPGFNDAFAAIPSFGITNGIANTMRGAERQKYMQGASSLSESLLRAATGAGVNQDEALQKVRELTPQIGDDDETIKQKEAAIPLYIESLKVRAGPGAKKVSGILQSTGGQGFGGSTTDPLGIRGR